MSTLRGKRIAILEARMGNELATLIRRNGGEVIQVPALKEAAVDASQEVNQLIEGLQSQSITGVVLQTGVGVAGVLNEAEKLQRKNELISLLQTTTIIARGPKPLAVLSRNGLKAQVTTAEPHTTKELIAALETANLSDQTIAVVHYGERNTILAETLETKGIKLFELCLYEWQLPEDLTLLRTLVTDIIQGAVDVVTFTSQIQARHLFQIADEMGTVDALRQSLQTQTTVASIGPTCTEALGKLGVTPHIEPEHPKMGFLVIALQEFFA